MSESKFSQSTLVKAGKVKLDDTRVLHKTRPQGQYYRVQKEALQMTRVGICAALRSLLVWPRRLFVRLNRRTSNVKALACFTSCGGRIAISYPADGRTLPIILGLNGGQMFDPDARIHIWLPALSDAQWSELKPCLQSLATLGSLQIAGRHVTGADWRNSLIDWMSPIEAKIARYKSPATEPLLFAVAESKVDLTK